MDIFDHVNDIENVVRNSGISKWVETRISERYRVIVIKPLGIIIDNESIAFGDKSFVKPKCKSSDIQDYTDALIRIVYTIKKMFGLKVEEGKLIKLRQVSMLYVLLSEKYQNVIIESKLNGVFVKDAMSELHIQLNVGSEEKVIERDSFISIFTNSVRRNDTIERLISEEVLPILSRKSLTNLYQENDFIESLKDRAYDLYLRTEYKEYLEALIVAYKESKAFEIMYTSFEIERYSEVLRKQIRYYRCDFGFYALIDGEIAMYDTEEDLENHMYKAIEGNTYLRFLGGRW